MIGQQLSPVLDEIEQMLWEFEANDGSKPNYTKEGFRGGIKIFMSVMMDKFFEVKKANNTPSVLMEVDAEMLGNEVRELVKKYTGIDTHELF